jgi:hypothetical protein
MPDNFYNARHRLSFANSNLLIKVTTSASFQGHVIDSVNYSIGLSMPHLGVSLEVPFIESITLTELGPPPSLTMCLLCTKPALNHLFCNDKKAESLIVAQRLESLPATDPGTPITYSCSVSPLTNSVFDTCELLMGHTAYADSMSQIEGV